MEFRGAEPVPPSPPQMWTTWAPGRVEDLIGRGDLLTVRKELPVDRAKKLDLSFLLTDFREAQGDQGGGGKAEALRPQHTGDGHVPAGHQLAVRLDGDSGASRSM